MVITNGGVLVLNGPNPTLRAGYDGDTTGTNLIDIAGVVRIPNADADTGWLALGRAGTRGIANLWPGGDLEVRGVASSDSGAAAAYSEFNFRGGVLRARESRATFMQGLTNAFVRSGGAIIDTAGFDVTIVQSLLNGGGGGGLIKNGAGSLRLAGTNTYTGATVVGAGALALSAANFAGAGPLTVSNGASLQVDIGGPTALNVSDLTLGSGGSVAVTLNYGILSGNPASPAVAVSGNTVAGATNIVIHLNGAGFTNGQFP